MCWFHVLISCVNMNSTSLSSRQKNSELIERYQNSYLPSGSPHRKNNKPSKVKTSKTASKPKKKHDPNAHIQENGVRPDPVAQFAQQEGFDSVQYKEDKDIYQRSVRKVQRWLMSIPDDPCSYSTWIYWRLWMKTRKKNKKYWKSPWFW